MRFPLCTCCRHYPGTATRIIFCSITASCQPSPLWQLGRPVHRPFRGLLGVHLRYGLHTRAVTVCRDALYPKASTISLPPSLLRCFRLEQCAGWDLHPLGSAAFHGARQERTSLILNQIVLSYTKRYVKKFAQWMGQPPHELSYWASRRFLS